MPPALAERLDLELAWKRARLDLTRRRCFVSHPFLPDLIDNDAAPWLDYIREAIHEGHYQPVPCRICEVPKPRGHLRPGGDLHLSDQVVFGAVVQELRPFIQDALIWPSGHPDYSYQLRADPNHQDWFERHFPRWKAFSRDSTELVDDGADFVVVADIAGYYELIDLFTLRSDLNGLGVPNDALSLLMDVLHRWTRIPRRGVPQGYSPSDLLAKLYLNAVDLVLKSEGLRHKRWVDDFRIFCEDRAEARRALVLLTRTLGRRGLILQSAKSEILTAAQAKSRFNEVSDLLQPLIRDYAQSLVDAGILDNPYVPIWELDDLLDGLEDDTPIEIFQRAYADHFIGDEHEFRKTLFHFLLARFGAAGDPHHSDHIIEQLDKHPEEFDYIAKYASRVGRVADLEERYVELREAGLLPYDYQLYQLFRWRLGEDQEPSQLVYQLARQKAFAADSAWYVRASARAVVGRWGPPADLESLEHSYAGTASDAERTEVICGLLRMETGRRNAFLGRAAGDGDFASRAVRAVREGRVRWDAC